MGGVLYLFARVSVRETLVISTFSELEIAESGIKPASSVTPFGGNFAVRDGLESRIRRSRKA